MKRSLLTLAIGAALFGPEAMACDVFAGGQLTPAQLIARADLIVVATALQPASAPDHFAWVNGGSAGTGVSFRIDEVLKGQSAPSRLGLSGHYEPKDEFDDRPVPYGSVRPGGRAGECFATGYHAGAQYLLFLEGGEGLYSVGWAALAPVNEQLRQPDDEWLRWVRSHVRSE